MSQRAHEAAQLLTTMAVCARHVRDCGLSYYPGDARHSACHGGWWRGYVDWVRVCDDSEPSN